MGHAVICFGKFRREPSEQLFQIVLLRQTVKIDEIPLGSPTGDRADLHAADIARIGHVHAEKRLKWKKNRVGIRDEAYFGVPNICVNGSRLLGDQSKFFEMLQLLEHVILVEVFAKKEVKINR